MTLTSAPDPATLLFGSHAADRPLEAYERLRGECPVARSNMGGQSTVYISRYEDVLWALRHPEIFSSAVEALSIGQEQPLIPLQVDPPQHSYYRRLLNPEFVPRKVAGLEPEVRALVNELIDTFAARGSCDFHAEFATPLPSTIFLALMGLPQDDLATFLKWRDDIIRPDVAPGDFAGAAAIRAATSKEINAYFEDALDRSRWAPDEGGGLMNQLVRLELDGRPLSQEELLGICHLLLLGGLDTVTATLDCMVDFLAHHPSDRDRLVEAPSGVPSAVEELLRRESPVTTVLRVVGQDAALGGVELHRGDHVTLVLGAANSDHREFADSGKADLGRDPNRHLAFGAGHHLCLGAHLARLELVVALQELHRRIPDYRVPDGVELHYSPGIRQAERLPLVFTPSG